MTVGSSLTTRVVWPWPEVSSTRRASPGPNRLAVPSPRPISSRPDSNITYCRRGAGCQSMKCPGGHVENTMLFVARGDLSSSLDSRSRSSTCDCPSLPRVQAVDTPLLPPDRVQPRGFLKNPFDHPPGPLPFGRLRTGSGQEGGKNLYLRDTPSASSGQALRLPAIPTCRDLHSPFSPSG